MGEGSKTLYAAGYEPACATCVELVERVERNGGVPVPTECRCRHGRFDRKGSERWFAPGGIKRPNRTVAEAQKDCPLYRRQSH